jgi:putative transposase
MSKKHKDVLKSKDVHSLTLKVLCQLPLVARGTCVKITDLLNVLIFAAAFRISVNQACAELQNTPCASYVLKELANQLHDLEQQQIVLNQIFASKLPNSLRKKGKRIAIDLVEVPYHGKVKKEHEGEVRRSKAKSGTTHFFVYATAYVIQNGPRYTLAMIRVRAEDTMVKVLKQLLTQLKKLGIKVSLLLLDRGFYSVKVIRYLIRQKQPFIMPAIKRGKKPEQDGGPTRTYQLAALKSSGWYRYTLTRSTDGKVSFDVAVVCQNLSGSRKLYYRETLLYVTFRVKHHPLNWIKETYRKRFGIESSYRQLNQAKIKTSTCNPALRLLFVACAFILRNIWVWLHHQVIASPRQGARIRCESQLRFQRLMLWLLLEVSCQYGLVAERVVLHDIYEAFDDL